MSIEFGDKGFIINGTSSEVVAKTLQGSGLSNVTIAEIIGGWFVGVTGAAQPAPFDFTTVVQSTDPQCAITYNRDFAHTDWIDGESRVQAGMTPEELGFNARFHGIENEFDAVAAQFTGLGRCVAEIRADLVGVVAELEAKITTMQNQIHALEQVKKPSTRPEIVGTATVGTKDIFITQFQDDFKFVEFSQQPLDPKAGPRPLPKDFDPTRFRTDDFVDLTEGLRRTFTLPTVEELFSPGTPVTVGDLRAAPVTATLTLPTGEALGSVLATMPAETAFDSPVEAVAAIVEHTVTALPAAGATGVRTGILTGEAVNRTGSALLSSSVTGIGLDEQTTRALSTAGLGTIVRLAAASPDDVASALTAAGLDPASASDVVAHAVVARAVRNVGGS